MRIYLVRHGKASKDPVYAADADRPLTARGRHDAALIAAQMARAGVAVHDIRHSGLVRARQTAEIFATHLNPPGGLKAVKGLHYADPPDTLARELHYESEPVLFVGHNPFMEELTGLLLTGERGQMPVRFSTACTACIERSELGWTLRWVLDRNIVAGEPPAAQAASPDAASDAAPDSPPDPGAGTAADTPPDDVPAASATDSPDA